MVPLVVAASGEGLSGYLFGKASGFVGDPPVTCTELHHWEEVLVDGNGDCRLSVCWAY